MPQDPTSPLVVAGSIALAYLLMLHWRSGERSGRVNFGTSFPYLLPGFGLMGFISSGLIGGAPWAAAAFFAFGATAFGCFARFRREFALDEGQPHETARPFPAE